MDCNEIVTATGSGTWYLPYEVALATVNRHWQSKYGPAEHEETTFELRFKKPEDMRWEHREFASQELRTEFLRLGFSELSLVPVENPTTTACAHLLTPIVGAQLQAVTFAMDTVQLQFDGHYFSCSLWPVVVVNGRRLRERDIGYRDGLCSLITQAVTRFDEYWDAGLVFEFANDHALEILIRDPFDWPERAGYAGPEGIKMFW